MKPLPRAELGLLGLGTGILILTVIAVSLHVPGSIWAGTLPRKDAVVALMLTSGLLYAAAVTVVTHLPVRRRAFWPVIAIAIAL